MWDVFLIVALFPFLALFFGIKALTPAGIEWGKGRKLPKKASTVIGILTVVASLAIIGAAYAYLVLRIRLPG